MKRYIKYIVVAMAIIGFSSCQEEALNPNSQIIDSNIEQNDFDRWLLKNYTEPYNIDFKYRMEFNESNMNYYLVPAEYNKAIKIAKLLRYLCLGAYDEVTGDVTFIRNYFPKMVHLVGSAAYKNNGTMVLGEAEGGLKMTLYYVNNLQLNPEFLNYYYFKTMHHEFAHILHQTKPYPADFKMISGSDYVADTWSEVWDDDADAQANGFISEYASKEANEDFVELIAIYITNTAAEWNSIISAAGEGGDIITSKFDIVYNYMNNSWGIDLDELRATILERQSHIPLLDLEDITIN
jgi:substrate import-associated zinc metallohydrolase lipoprotein